MGKGDPRKRNLYRGQPHQRPQPKLWTKKRSVTHQKKNKSHLKWVLVEEVEEEEVVVVDKKPPEDKSEFEDYLNKDDDDDDTSTETSFELEVAPEQ